MTPQLYVIPPFNGLRNVLETSPKSPIRVLMDFTLNPITHSLRVQNHYEIMTTMVGYLDY